MESTGIIPMENLCTWNKIRQILSRKNPVPELQFVSFFVKGEIIVITLNIFHLELSWFKFNNANMELCNSAVWSLVNQSDAEIGSLISCSLMRWRTSLLIYALGHKLCFHLSSSEALEWILNFQYWVDFIMKLPPWVNKKLGCAEEVQAQWKFCFLNYECQRNMNDMFQILVSEHTGELFHGYGTK